ncbi:MAG: filamentous hemagglutinin N-terminal domain-containing protein [Cyanobacteria bacterium P01_H01_bin.162]
MTSSVFFTGCLRALPSVIFSGSIVLGWPAQAQITPDATLGTEGSQITPDATVQGELADLIAGGARRGGNLFHSFEEFNVGAGQRVYFANPLGLENIFSRVTGDDASNILGTLGVAGPADLFLLNPHGVVFGPDAELDVMGSFWAGTADSLTFADGTEYLAKPESNNQILTVSTPLGLQTGTPQQGRIRNEANLQLPVGETLTLLGQEIAQSGTIAIPTGTVRLLGDRVRLTDTAMLDVSGVTGGGTVQIGGDFQGQGELPTASQTAVAAGATLLADGLVQGDGGTIIVWANGETEFAGLASVRGGALAGSGGLVEVSGADTLSYAGQVDARAPQGAIGTLLLDPTDIVIDIPAAAAISASLADVALAADRDITFNAPIILTAAGVGLTAEAGRDITINQAIEAQATGNLRFIAGRHLTYSDASAYTWSYGGDIELTAGAAISLLNGAQVDTAPFFGDSGDLDVTAGTLTLTNGAQLKTGPFFNGAGGNLRVNVSDTASISGVGFDNSGNFGSSGFFSSSLLRISTGTSGDIAVSVPNLLLLDGGAISAQNINGQPGGAITINAPTQIQLAGEATNAPGFFSSISASTTAGGDGGSVAFTSDRLGMTNGGFVSASALDVVGNGGNIDIAARDLSIIGTGSLSGDSSGIFNRAFGLGNAGGVTIRNTEAVTIQQGGTINISALGFGTSGTLDVSTQNLTLDEGSVLAVSFFGNGGNVNVSASDTILITNESGFSSDIVSAGTGGNFDLRAEKIVVSDRSLLSTLTAGAGTGGNLTVQADIIEVTNDSFISTGTLFGTGNGGNLTVRADRLLVNDATVEANSTGTGNAGSVFVEANDIRLHNQGEIGARGLLEDSGTGDVRIDAGTVQLEDQSRIIVSAPSTDGGSIFLSASDRVVLRRQSTIAANAGELRVSPGTGNGGNISITTPFVIALPAENSDITASASLGNGGNVTVQARGVFGIAFRDTLTPESDITATSEFGLSGTVNLDVLDTGFLENNLSAFDETVVDTNILTAGSCIVRADDSTGSFVVTGTAGLPQQPVGDPISAYPTGTVQTPVGTAATTAVQEPQGVYRLADGRLVLSHECG